MVYLLVAQVTSSEWDSVLILTDRSFIFKISLELSAACYLILWYHAANVIWYWDITPRTFSDAVIPRRVCYMYKPIIKYTTLIV